MLTKIARILATFQSAAVMAACSQTPSFDAATAVPQIDQFVRSEYGMGGTCGERFDFSDFSIVDKKVDGDKAQIGVTFRITSRRLVTPYALSADICYRTPPEGWQVGQSAMIRRDFTFEKWESGWRLSRR